MKIVPLEEHVLRDGEGVEIRSGEHFSFRCCDCSLVHSVVIVSQDGLPVGLALQRESELTYQARATDAADPGWWQFNLFLKLKKFYRSCGQPNIWSLSAWRPAWPVGHRKSSTSPPQREITYAEFLRRLDQGLLSPGGRTDILGKPREDQCGTPGRSGIWAEDASGQWTPLGAKHRGTMS